MTRDRYLKMCEQMGQEPLDDEIPPDLEDFPDIAVQALITFQSLGDRVYPDIGYMGKDFTTLPYYIDMHGNKKKLIRDKSGNLDNLNNLLFSGIISIAYNLKIGEFFLISPEIKYCIPFNSIANDIDYLIHTMQAGISVKFEAF